MSFDDHEIENNWAGDIDQANTAPEIFALRKLAALQAWYENMPVRKAQFPSLQRGGVTAFRRLDYGRLLRVHVLDTRSYRSDQSCDDGKRPCDRSELVSPEVLGREQERWLDDGLDYPGAWNLLAQQITLMPIDSRAHGASEGKYNTDIWDGYRPARQRLIDMLKRHGRSNVVVASGDLHRHVVGEVPEHDEDPGGTKVAVEFQGTSISSSGNGTGDQDSARLLSNNPHFDLYTDRRGYQVFDITPAQWTTDVKVIDQVERPGGTISTIQRYAVAPGRAKVERVR
jgi:alkaline phosphatase D